MTSDSAGSKNDAASPTDPDSPNRNRALEENEEFKRQARRGWDAIRERRRNREDTSAPRRAD